MGGRTKQMSDDEGRRVTVVGWAGSRRTMMGVSETLKASWEVAEVELGDEELTTEAMDGVVVVSVLGVGDIGSGRGGKEELRAYWRLLKALNERREEART